MKRGIPGFEIKKEPPTLRGRVALRVRLFDVYLRTVYSTDIRKTWIGRRVVDWAWRRFDEDDHVVSSDHPLLKGHGEQR